MTQNQRVAGGSAWLGRIPQEAFQIVSGWVLSKHMYLPENNSTDSLLRATRSHQMPGHLLEGVPFGSIHEPVMGRIVVVLPDPEVPVEADFAPGTVCP
jgi:hypothetical protein